MKMSIGLGISSQRLLGISVLPPPPNTSAFFTANEDGTFAITNMPTTLPTDPQFTSIGDGNMSWT